ncbi:transglycosylase SLT domain-containing protein [Nocardia sp. CA-120079]|uniref:transglycosylase SLT domain-containing protein n=1 Tax=Nocardia sp. CA-120079 TaxID=3239974 RepID=UPI003D98BF8C
MPPPQRDTPDPSLGDAHEPRPGTTTSTPHRNATRRGSPRAPTGPAPALAQQPAATAAARGQAAAPVAESGTAATGSPIARPDALAGFGTSAPYAAAALGALASMAAQYGRADPTADTGQSYAPPALGSGQPTSWPGESGDRYAANNLDTANRAQSTQSLNAELGRLLGGTADSTIRGRAAIDGIIAEVNTAITALGGVADTAAGRQMLTTTLSNALQRAGTVLGQGQAAAAITADKVAALADRFLRNARPTRQPPQRRAQPSTSGSSARPPRTRPSGRQGQWINDALRILAANGYDTRHINPADIAAIIQHESAGDPNAINLWDSNAAKGTPSKGLMQTIDPTFNAYSLPGHRDVWNPVDNIIAGVRYAIHRYGSVSNVPGIQSMHEGGHYVGY